MINKILQNIKYPKIVQRKPRTLEDLKYWKASEIKLFLLVFSLPIFANFMENKYLEHYKLLIYGISLLNKSSVSEDMVEKAKKAFHEFVSRFKDLYGEEHMTINIHFLLHLPEMVRDFGPLYIFSCFEFENLNGILKNFVHSPKKAELQICTMTSLFLNFDTIKRNFLHNLSVVSIFCKELDSCTFYRNKHLKINDELLILGNVAACYSSLDKIKDLLKTDVYKNIYFFARMVCKNIFYDTDSYCRSLKTNSSYVQYYSKRHSVEKFGQITHLLRICNCASVEISQCSEMCKICAVVKPVNSKRFFFVNNGLDHVQTMHKFDEIQQTCNELILVSDLKCVLYKLEVSVTNVFLIQPTNLVETE